MRTRAHAGVGSQSPGQGSSTLCFLQGKAPQRAQEKQVIPQQWQEPPFLLSLKLHSCYVHEDIVIPCTSGRGWVHVHYTSYLVCLPLQYFNQGSAGARPRATHATCSVRGSQPCRNTLTPCLKASIPIYTYFCIDEIELGSSKRPGAKAYICMYIYIYTHIYMVEQSNARFLPFKHTQP